TGNARIQSLDVLRGVATLMIFVVNIKMMANGFNHYTDRTLWAGESAQVIGYLHNLLVHGKFVTIFTALFGAGLALLLAREEPVPLVTVIRRLFWLAVFGILHLVFIREGDILVLYALVGCVAIPFVRMSGPLLLTLGVAGQAMLFVASIAFPIRFGEVPILWQTGPDMHLAVQRIMMGTFVEQVSARIDTLNFYLVELFLFGRDWFDKLTVMVIGMGLLKTGFLTGQLSPRLYWRIGFASLASALLLVGFRLMGGAEWPFGDVVLSGLWILHRFGGALAWSALIIGAVAAGWKVRAGAAVGRMAFTIYIAQSVVGLALFSSLGLGLFGKLSLPSLTLLTALICASFLGLAPLWLARYRFGPLEWLWRTLTYGKRPRLAQSSV
ncbi:MAG: DUF418 domain-containing protein, partial [Myxococcota bacterium]